MFQLIKAFQRAMMNIPKKVVHEVRSIPWSIEEQGAWLMQRFDQRTHFNFTEIMREMKEKMQVIVTFIALLELIRARRVRVEVFAQYNDIDIIRNEIADEHVPKEEQAESAESESAEHAETSESHSA
jgi:segregation and condensation protein A